LPTCVRLQQAVTSTMRPYGHHSCHHHGSGGASHGKVNHFSIALCIIENTLSPNVFSVK
jgi:hypothetical protein